MMQVTKTDKAAMSSQVISVFPRYNLVTEVEDPGHGVVDRSAKSLEVVS
jgi:hypothetical protein